MKKNKTPMRVWEYDGLDPTDPWLVRPSMLAAISNALRTEASPELVAAAAKAPEARTLRMGPAEEDGAGQGVAVIQLRGVITPRGSLLAMLFGFGGGLENFRAQFRDAISSEDVGAIVIDIDSPGGSSSLVAETADEIYAARGEKPIVAVANTMAASAAYWIAAQADEVVGSPSSLVGSIGTYTIHEDWSKFNEDFGVKPTYISAGKYKTEGNPDEPLSDTALAAIQQTVDDFQAMFVEAVARGRDTTAKKVADGYGEGRALPAQRALAENLIDRVAPVEAVIAGLLAGLADDSGAGSAPAGATPVELPQAEDGALAPEADTETSTPASREDAAARSRLLLAKPRH